MDSDRQVCALRDVEVWYSRTSPSLGPLSLTVWPGEVIGSRGPNGAGKSTLLSLLAGALRPDRGECRLAPETAGHVGYVPQDLSLYQELTGLDNLKFWGLANGLPSRAVRARSRWLLEQLDLTEKGNVRVSAYSGGMQRRLHLASALMVTPKLLLLDEPTVGADAHSAQRILGMITHLARQGCAVLLISHIPQELESTCSRILNMNEGLVVREEVLG